MEALDNANPDAIIVGSGLAGLTAALTILDAGGRVIILEKEATLGGNSMKASSGINVCHDNPEDQGKFRQDTLQSAGRAKNPELVEQLVLHSKEAILGWLQDRLQVDLSQISQLGGHSQARTYRPGGKLPVGAEIMIKLQRAVREFESKGLVTVLSQSKATKLVKDESNGDRVTGVMYELSLNNLPETKQVNAPNVVLATGGFASDRSQSSWLAQVRPELLNLGATAGGFSTGDGLKMATSIGADLVGMEHIQVHPTGFVDPNDPENPNKVLAAEVLRGMGGILLNSQGKRFCNEIGRRDYVTDRIFALNHDYAKTNTWNAAYKVPEVFLLLSEEGATYIPTHIGFYAGRGFMIKRTGLQSIAEYMGVPKGEIRKTLLDYAKAAKEGKDEFGKEQFLCVPKLNGDGDDNKDEEDLVMYVGKVVPVLHYCMGGIKIDTQARALASDGSPIPGLYAVGEVSGGVHGENRLAGNSLCECVVFGRIVGQAISSCRQSGKL